jgi:hypothetical protein
MSEALGKITLEKTKNRIEKKPNKLYNLISEINHFNKLGCYFFSMEYS